MAAAGFAIAIPVTIALRDGDEERSGDVEPPQIELQDRVYDSELGVEYQLPRGWKSKSGDRALEITNEERDVAVAISATGPREDAGEILDEALAAVEQGYSNVETVTRLRGERVGGLPARGVVSAARSRDGQDLRVLVLVARGEELAYLVQVFAAGEGPGSGLVEAQAMLNGLVFEG